MAKTVSAMEVRNRLGDLLSRASYAGEQFIIERRGKPVAVLMGIEEYQRYLALREAAPSVALEDAEAVGRANDLTVDKALAVIQKALQEVKVRS
jgi:prevent-host-death family protein